MILNMNGKQVSGRNVITYQQLYLILKYVKKTEDGKLSLVKVNGRDEYEFENEELKAEYGKVYEEFMSRGLEFHI